jgi:hypothetical protein
MYEYLCDERLKLRDLHASQVLFTRIWGLWCFFHVFFSFPCFFYFLFFVFFSPFEVKVLVLPSVSSSAIGFAKVSVVARLITPWSTVVARLITPWSTCDNYAYMMHVES